ncbi:MAG TPA: hypothetical protein VF533_14800 [Solirubrobacteraceae bacterium]|jgi:hypothetical protein
MAALRFLGIAAAVLAATLAGVAAASALTGTASQSEPPPAAEQFVPRDGTTRVTPGAADPDGGPRWGVRTYTSREGQSCVEVGRVTPGGRYGRLEANGEVAELPSAPSGVCGDLDVDPVILAINTRAARGGLPARTVLYGQAAPDVEAMTAGAPGRAAAPVALTGERTFVVVAEGIHEASEFPVDVRTRDGEVTRYRW